MAKTMVMVQAAKPKSKENPKTPRLKIWTKQGLCNLGLTIRNARTQKGLSLDKMAEVILDKTGILINKKTLGNIENATGMPQYNTLAAIAASGIVTKQGQYLSIEDFIDIASEVDLCYTSTTNSIMTLEEMISQCLRENNISQESAENTLMQQVGANIGHISLDRFRDIQAGNLVKATIEELRLIANAVDPEQDIFSWWDWEAHAIETEKNPAQSRGENNSIS